MNVKLTHHASELLEAARAQSGEPVELILEHALESLVRERHLEPAEGATRSSREQAVSEMLDFVKRNRVHLGPDLSVKDLIREGHRL